MAKPARPKQPSASSAIAASNDQAIVPRETVDILNEGLGINVSTERPDKVMAVIGSITRSMSSSPYTSAEMLREYRDGGFPDLVDKVIQTIDTENHHRQELESFVVTSEQGRLNRAQIGSQVIAGGGIVGALVGGHYGVPTYICVAVAIVAVGGPPVATIAARLLDRFHSASK